MEKLIEELEDIICHKSLNREEIDTIVRTIGCFRELDNYLRISFRESISKSNSLKEIADHTHDPVDVSEADQCYGMSVAYENMLRKLIQHLN